MKTWKWTLAMLAAVSLLTACTKNQTAAPSPQTPPAQGQTGGAAAPGGTTGGTTGGAAGGAPGKAPAANVKLVPVTYADAEKQMVTSTAKTAGLKTVYLPQQLTSGDKLNQVGLSGGVMTLELLKLSMQESAKEIVPAGKAESETPVKLSVGDGKWVTVGGQSTLYVKTADTYVAIIPSKNVSKDETQAVAETLKPVQ